MASRVGPMMACLDALLAHERAEAARDAAEAAWRWRMLEGAPESELDTLLERLRVCRERAETAWRLYVRSAMAMHAYASDVRSEPDVRTERNTDEDE